MKLKFFSLISIICPMMLCASHQNITSVQVEKNQNQDGSRKKTLSVFSANERTSSTRAAKGSILKKICEQNSLKQHRVGVRHREANGIGYSQGYTTLDAFFSYLSNQEKWYPFFDLRGHVFNNGKLAANAGIGLRYLADQLKMVFGGNAYYDYRQKKHMHYNQIGAGFEALWRKWDLRLNGYFPVGRTKSRISEGFWGFEKHSAFFSKKYEFAMTGGDLELGREIYTHKYFDLHGMLSGYYFNGDYGKDAIGGLFRATGRIGNYLTIEGQVSYDSLFHFIAQAEIGLTYPFGKYPKAKDKSCSLANRLVESVPRFEIIATKKHNKKVLARDATTGQPLHFVFVDNVNGGSNGSFEHPYATLVDAQVNSSPGDVIYVFAGNGTTGGMDQGIALQASQKLLGSGTPYAVTTSFGPALIPARTLTMPSIENTLANVVVSLNANNTVNGFNIVASNASGVGIENAQATLGTTVITNNTIVSGSYSINVSSYTDNANLRIANNTLTAGGSAIVVGPTGGLSEATVNSNTVLSTLDVGILLEPQATAPDICTLKATVNGNSVLNATMSQGIDLHGINNGILNVVAENNSVSNTGLSGIRAIAENTAQVYAEINNNYVRNANLQGGVLIAGIEAASAVSVANTGVAVRILNNNSAGLNGATGYVFNQASSGKLYVQSITDDLAGVEMFNFGTASATAGTVTFIPLIPANTTD